MRQRSRNRFAILAATGVLYAAGARAQTQLTVDAGVPLHVTLVKTAGMKAGAPVEGVLTEPVWVYDRMVWPKGAVVRGVVASLAPLGGQDRLEARLNGDLTPLKVPTLRFTSVRADGRETSLDAEGGERQTQAVRFMGAKKHGIREMARGLMQEKINSYRDQVTAPGKRDRILRLTYNQLPYHPQRIWQGTEFVAEVQQPVRFEVPDETGPKLVDAAELAGSLPPATTVHARLLTALDSNSTKQGTAVAALVTEPVWSANQELILPEGARLRGTVLRVKPSKSFGRNGALRFTFKDVQRQDETAQKLRGTVVGAGGAADENLTVDDEGNVQAQPAKNRFAAPLLLAALAAGGHDSDGGVGRQVVAANGLGIVARSIAATTSSPNAAAGFWGLWVREIRVSAVFTRR